MLEQYFSDARAIKRHREGSLGSCVDGFVSWLSGQGYARGSVRFFVAVFSDLGRWLHRRKLGARDLSSELTGRYLRRSGSNRVRPPLRLASFSDRSAIRSRISGRGGIVPDDAPSSGICCPPWLEYGDHRLTPCCARLPVGPVPGITCRACTINLKIANPSLLQ